MKNQKGPIRWRRGISIGLEFSGETGKRELGAAGG